MTIDWGCTALIGDTASIEFRSHEWLVRRAAVSEQPSVAPQRLEDSRPALDMPVRKRARIVCRTPCSPCSGPDWHFTVQSGARMIPTRNE